MLHGGHSPTRRRLHLSASVTARHPSGEAPCRPVRQAESWDSFPATCPVRVSRLLRGASKKSQGLRHKLPTPTSSSHISSSSRLPEVFRTFPAAGSFRQRKQLRCVFRRNFLLSTDPQSAPHLYPCMSSVLSQLREGVKSLLPLSLTHKYPADLFYCVIPA